MKKADAVKEWKERRTAREWLMRFLYGMDVQAMQLQELDDWFEIYRAQEETEPVSEDASVLEGIKPVKAEEDSAVQEESHHLSDKQMAFIRRAISSIVENLEEIDDCIAKHLKGWEYSRLPRVDKAILRLAVNEILYDDHIPVGASINEAVELSKKYSSDTSFRFLNGVLGNIARERES